MKILAIETSCDDTGIAILKITNPKAQSPNFNVLANVVASQVELGKKYGGVYPMMAKRAHEKNLQPTLETALKTAKTNLENIDLIAVTNGPGLEPCLWTGVNFAKNLAEKYNIPLVPANHIEGHILVNFVNGNSKFKIRNLKKLFPAVALVVSGGHTQIILVKKIGNYEVLGETRDDAAGECFDKCAKILGLGYPGGPIIAELAERVRPSKVLEGRTLQQLPRPMIHTKDYDFSFSGLKTAVLYAWQKQKESGKFFHSSEKTHQLQIEFSAEIQQAIIDVLIKKTIKAVKDYKAKTLILGGGVSANCELRSQFKSEIRNSKSEINFLAPPAHLSTDNGLMIAIAGFYNKKSARLDLSQLCANGNLRIDK